MTDLVTRVQARWVAEGVATPGVLAGALDAFEMKYGVALPPIVRDYWTLLADSHHAIDPWRAVSGLKDRACVLLNRVGTRPLHQDASMSTDVPVPTPLVIPVHCAPKNAPCPKCGKLGRRTRTLTRTVRTLAYKTVAFLELTYGEYHARCGCSTTFRNTPKGVLPKANYDNKVRELVLERIVEDGMSMQPILQSLQREFPRG